MPVVINEFEVLADEPRKAEAKTERDEHKADEGDRVEPLHMLALLQRLEARALRTWAH